MEAPSILRGSFRGLGFRVLTPGFGITVQAVEDLGFRVYGPRVQEL